MTDHPYRHLPDRCFWARSVAENFDAATMIDGKPMIRIGEKVVSAGSCFAANLVPYLEGAGLTYHRTESRHPAFASAAPEAFGYERFSAAYGNLYTTRQLLQLLRRARGQFMPAEDRWPSGDVIRDPFRPALKYPARSDREFDALTRQHLERTLKAFVEADVFIFTLSLTEAWVSTNDGAVYPACPGTIAGTFDPDRYKFVNFTAQEVADDLRTFIEELRELNPDVRFIVTVSPVPLVATATGGHALVATTYSKSALRVAAERVKDDLPGVTYFPSYEIITGPQAPWDFFEKDRRSVTKAGVDCVMSAFLAHCETSSEIKMPTSVRASKPKATSIVDAECEEEMVARS